MNRRDVLGLILGGGRGSRLWPLTQSRAKPAVPIAGKYRLIDIPVSNCLNSGIYQIAILTQFNSVSLHRHITQTFRFDQFREGWVEILAAEQTASRSDWYQGTADAVRKQLMEIESSGANDVLILSGDHIYRMDYGEMLHFHRDNKADITLAVKPISREDASRFGVLKQKSDATITDFTEKPDHDDILSQFISRDDQMLPYLGSLGIYAFRMDVLLELLDSDHVDFGNHLIPAAIQSHRVQGYIFNGYWEDIGTIRSFFDVNLALAVENPLFSFHDARHPIFTNPRFLPASRVSNAQLKNVKFADGSVINDCTIENAVIGIRSMIGTDVNIRNTIIMGSDYYDDEFDNVIHPIQMGIGSGSSIENAIIDKNARIGPNVQIKRFPKGTERDESTWVVRDGILVIPKNTVIPEGTVIGPE